MPVAFGVFIAYVMAFIGLSSTSGVAYSEFFASSGNAYRAAVLPLAAGSLVLILFTWWARWDFVFRDPAKLGMTFASINYYDGAGFMVRRSSNVKSARELDGAVIVNPYDLRGVAQLVVPLHEFAQHAAERTARRTRQRGLAAEDEQERMLGFAAPE